MKKNVLLLEDNESSRRLLSKLLFEMGGELTVYEADNIGSAYRYAVECTIHLFLLDIIIDTSVSGDVSGLTFASNLRQMKQYKKTPIIFITSLQDPKLFTYSELHCYQFIEKPYDREMTLRKVREALELTAEDERNKKVCFRKDGLIFPVAVSKILYITFEKPVTRIYQIDDMLEISYQPVHRMLYRLNSRDILQCNRSTVININYIENIDTANSFVKMKYTEKLLTLGSVYKKKLIRELEDG